MFFPIPTPDGNEVFPIHDDGREARWAMGKTTVFDLLEKKLIVWKKRELLGKETWVPYTREYAPSNPSRPYSTIWIDLDTTRQTKAHQKTLFNNEIHFDTPKPEDLIERILNIASDKGDHILDSFLGSGTTAAVAHKTDRNWIGIELGEHCNTLCVPRLIKVCDGTDQGGISKSVNWKGGGGFKYYYLAPSLLKQDPHGNWIIDERYNPDMLAAAMAKHEGFKYSPHEEIYWKQGQSTEQDFIFTTTQFVTVEMLDRIDSEMGPEESLLICCRKFSSACKSKYENITIKKIPNMLLGRCEFGRDDYSLNIVNMPQDPDAPEYVPPGPPREVKVREENPGQTNFLDSLKSEKGGSR